jgi:hypothetical protein
MDKMRASGATAKRNGVCCNLWPVACDLHLRGFRNRPR